MIKHSTPKIPVILCLNCHDPSGFGGIQADIETGSSLGCQTLTVLTGALVKDTREIKKLVPSSPELVIDQIRAQLEDTPVDIIKAGYMSSIENIEALHSVLIDYPDIPFVLEPKVLNVPKLSPNYNAEMIDAIRSLLLPKARVAVTTHEQALTLSNYSDTIDACAAEILESGCQHVLINGSHNFKPTRCSQLFGKRGLIHSYDCQYENLSEILCTSTLGAAVACYQAHGLAIHDGVDLAQKYLWDSVFKSRQFGMGAPTPNRMHWAESLSKQ
ncbi:bifunctional hydroxymethylpyrimidine kinase/phosphomethylpyrimidine kinase [Sessilibacter corallicola]|uniref:Hydroxymethylpyrimidine/phosphomethylpyrimidine kinase n=1 Tax=Sessilibacter corallicola TaxID=2904075 RepID=A0ABQ0A526_9GAMM|nr:bifunctional hydroxymethylpyrimidine kinase/phosphomethylpyrimidine kinase [Sessilibacter corallicola]MCE2027540.1 bifunctional hydroxymethylpyrimidine kinase/phosphomethylpyrimidine kinase [Sessilibacter corallicola]